MTSEPLLVVAGSIHYDHVLRLPHLPVANDRLRVLATTLAPGGMGGNVAAIAARLGARVRFAGSFARDDDGESLRDDLIRDGVDVQFAGTHDGPSGRGLVLVGTGGQRAILSGSVSSVDLERAPGRRSDPTGQTARQGRRDARDHASVFTEPFRDPGLFDGAVAGFACPGNFAPMLLPLVPDGLPLFIDVETGHFDDLAAEAVDEVLRRATVVYVNGPNAERLADRLTGGAVEALAARVGNILAVTRGAAGCRIRANGETWDVPGIGVDEVDTTGAGDSFAAAFTVAHLRGMPPEQAGRFANVVAGLSTRALGSRSGVPGRDVVETTWRASNGQPPRSGVGRS